MNRVYHPPRWGKKSWPGFAQGLGLAALLFLLLPLTQFFAGNADEVQEPRRVDTAPSPPLPPPPPPPAEPEEPAVSPAAAPVQEALERPPPPLTLRELRLALEPEPDMPSTGDFAVDFDVAHSGIGEIDAFELADVDQPPRAVSSRPPRYPPDLRRAGISGSVTLLFVVEQDGSVRDVQVETSDHRALERPALDAVRTWRFTPGERAGEPVRTIVRQTLEFTIE